ncbi:formate/nitrite transporter family protein [Sporosalibacterium faouarense]|uniref:formate/nitrite transporter family protein n=1 Tax=Sporosalibacterium faouarense TaxID=516123 RepID=UPI00141D6AC8|nr:formate/nitrite transporter family protein [Sporosalibacterium faouarense]MTI48448.1 formate/nitrite transporter family protein [Bacillota bacterium]
MNIINILKPNEIANETVEIGIKKTNRPAIKMFLLGILAGAFIAFASEGSNMAAFNLFAKAETYGLGKVLSGAIFGTGLMLVILAGGELFTGNTLIMTGVLEKKIKVSAMLKNWFFVYLGNFVGAVFIAFLINQSGLLNSGANQLGAMTIKIASYKVGLSFGQAFILGVMCNWLVCLAVWMAYGAKDMTGKIFAMFFPIWLFVTSGFEHSIANMYYIPAGIMAKGNSALINAANLLGLTPEKLNALTWKAFFTKNLLPVTLGNIIGGGVFVAVIYWYVYIRDEKKSKNKEDEMYSKA